MSTVVSSGSISAALAPWSGLFKKKLSERQDLLLSCQFHVPAEAKEEEGKASHEQLRQALITGGLTPERADLMIENCVGILGLPLGVAPTFVINGQHYVVPMAVEEPSVIAAASGAAKLIAEAGGGFTATSTGNIMIGQVQILDLEGDLKAVAEKIVARKAEIIERGNTFCPNMVKRGGGVKDVEAIVRQPRSADRKPFVVVHLKIDVCDAMGANIVNTVAEGVAPLLSEISGGRVGLRILSNLATERMTTARFRLPVSALAYKGVEGKVVAERVLEAYHFAEDDPYRAATNNKGIMNGMDAVALATGQDWRAIEAGAHAYAARNGYYASLTRYAIEKDEKGDEYFVGEITLPLSVGVVGGALHTHPLYKLTLELLRKPNAQQLAQIIASVGLAQNFAAIRALAIEGIQRGHMALHARNVAVAAGAPTELVSEVAAHLVSVGKIDKDTAIAYLKSRQQ